MSQLVKYSPTGKIDRRSKIDEMDEDAVMSRENLAIIGTKNKKIKKIPGSDRYNSSNFNTFPSTWAVRYYTKANLRKNFFFSQGSLNLIDDQGNVTALMPNAFLPSAYPCSFEMRVSGGDILFFSEGYNTGMYSYDGNANNQFNKEPSVTLNPVGMVNWLDRAWVFEEDSEVLNFSVNLNPVNFTDATDAGAIVIGAKRGSKIQQIIVFNEVLYVFKTDSVWVIRGRTPSDFAVYQVVDGLGLAARRSLINTDNAIMGLMSDYEVHSFQSSVFDTTLLTYDLALGGDLTKDLIPIINRDRMEQVCAVYHNLIYRLSFVENGDTVNKMEYCYSKSNGMEWITRGANISCYLKYDRFPDYPELITGRSDDGFLMYQYRGLNWDNQAANPTMPIKMQTKFYGLKQARNMRVKRFWLNGTVLGARDLNVNMYIDGRNALSDATTDSFNTLGEEKNITNNVRIVSQAIFTSRMIPKHNNSNCQNFSLEINENINNRDLEFSSVEAEIIVKSLKRSIKVGT